VKIMPASLRVTSDTPMPLMFHGSLPGRFHLCAEHGYQTMIPQEMASYVSHMDRNASFERRI